MKRLIICSDGTWNIPDQTDRDKRKPSNVVKLARGILPSDELNNAQIVFYDQGVGTYRGLDRWIGGISGTGLSKNVLDSYRFLLHNYEPGDEIFLFGFSRGAFTVRSLAGFIQSIGLLPKENAFFTPEAWQLYRTKPRNKEALKQFRLENGTRSLPIQFIGVWDTVGSLGIPIGGSLGRWLNRRNGFHDVMLGPNVRYAYHALAIDEHRSPFRPTLWEIVHDTHEEVIQAWFAGVHTNIGGGYDKDGLANCALKWIQGKATNCGLAFNMEFLKHYRCWAGHELRNSRTGVYRIFGKYSRPIGAHPRSNEIVHDSAMQRLKLEPPVVPQLYRPKNLLVFLKMNP